MYCIESEVLDSSNCRRLATVLKKDSCTVGDAAAALLVLVPVLFLAEEGTVLDGLGIAGLAEAEEGLDTSVLCLLLLLTCLEDEACVEVDEVEAGSLAPDGDSVDASGGGTRFSIL